MLFEPTKRAAIRLLQRSAAGEALLLRTYLFAEEQAESSALDGLVNTAPPWLRRRAERQQVEERGHVALLRTRLAELGQAPGDRPRLDPISARKLERMRQLVEGYVPRFEAGRAATQLAVIVAMEEMAVRVFERHRQQLPKGHALIPILERLARDERKHCRVCADSLRRLVQPHERSDLEALQTGIEEVEQSFRGLEVVLLFIAGVGLWLKADLASCTWPWRMRAGT